MPYQVKVTGRWAAQGRDENRKRVALGTYATREEAEEAEEAARIPGPDRFWSRVEQTAECWLWTGCFNDTGYGQMRWGGRQGPAHRYAFELLVGPIPDGHEVHHRCQTPACVRPEHLEALPRPAHARVHSLLRRHPALVAPFATLALTKNAAHADLVAVGV